MRKPVVIVLVAGLVAGGAFLYLRPACACVTPNAYGRELMRGELDSLASLEVAYRARHAAFALRLEDLAYQPDSLVRVQLADGADSVLHIVATFLPRPSVRCSLAVSAVTGTRGTTTCSD